MKNPRTVAFIFAAAAIVFVFIGIFSRRQPWPPDQSQKSAQETQPGDESVEPTPQEGQDQAGLANPASVYCEENEGSLEIIDDPEGGGQYGICFFDDGSFCEEWQFFRGECEKGQYTIEDLELEATPTGESVIEESYFEPPTCSSCGKP